MSSQRSIGNGTRRHRSRGPAALAPALAALVLLTGACEASVRLDTDEPAPGGATGAPTSPTPSADAAGSPSTATESASPSSSPTATATASAAPPSDSASNASLVDRLLAAEEMPSLGGGDEGVWRTGRTLRSEVPDPFAACHRFAMDSVGATRVVVRGYRAGRDDAGGSGVDAGHLVAQFADPRTARTAYDVLRAWHRDCAEQLREHDRAEVGDLRDVQVTGGEGRWYLLTYGPPTGGGPGEVYLDVQGMALHGTRVAVLRMRTVGGEADGSRLHKPIQAAVAEAAAQLG